MIAAEVELAAGAIFEQVWRTRAEFIRQNGPTATARALLVLVGYELWLELRKRPEVAESTGPWSDRVDGTMRCVDAEVHPVEPPLVETLTSWRLVRDELVA